MSVWLAEKASWMARASAGITLGTNRTFSPNTMARSERAQRNGTRLSRMKVSRISSETAKTSRTVATPAARNSESVAGWTRSATLRARAGIATRTPSTSSTSPAPTDRNHQKV